MRTVIVLLGASALLSTGCSSDPAPVPAETSSTPSPRTVTLSVVAQAERAYGEDVGRFTLPPGTTELTVTTSCTTTDDGVSRPRVTFVIDTGTPGDAVLTSVQKCGGTENTASTSIGPDVPSTLTYRVTPSDPLGISWRLSVAAGS